MPAHGDARARRHRLSRPATRSRRTTTRCSRKLIVVGRGPRRARARRCSPRCADCEVAGVATNIAFLERVVAHEAFATGELDTGPDRQAPRGAVPAAGRTPARRARRRGGRRARARRATRRPRARRSAFAVARAGRAGGRTARATRSRSRSPTASRRTRSRLSRDRCDALSVEIDGERTTMRAARGRRRWRIDTGHERSTSSVVRARRGPARVRARRCAGGCATSIRSRTRARRTRTRAT